MISSRSVRRLGSFRPPVPERGMPARIMISSALLEDEESFWDTVRHEYAHAAVWQLFPGQRHGHDRVWKGMCRRIGCTPKSAAPVSEESEALRRRRAKYMVRCDACGTEVFYLRAGKVVKLLERGFGRGLRCGKCGSSRLRLFERD